MQQEAIQYYRPNNYTTFEFSSRYLKIKYQGILDIVQFTVLRDWN